jgi:hypothetical protein
MGRPCAFLGAIMARRMNTIAWWHWFPSCHWRIVATVESADDVPRHIPRNGVVLVGTGSYSKWIIFDCPCRQGHRIMLNTDRSRFPYWRFKMLRSDKLTISPSVDFCGSIRRCHYFLRAGTILWVKDTDNDN